MADEKVILDTSGLTKLWEIIKSHLSGKAAATHTHTQSEITDFPTALKNPKSLTIKANGVTYKTYNGGSAVTADISPALIGAAEEGHTHATSDIDGLSSALNNKAAKTHTHAISDVSDLQTALDAKADTDHAHVISATNKVVATSAWVSSTTYTDYPYQAKISISGVTSSMIPNVTYGSSDNASGNFAPFAQATSDGVIIYAKTKPTASITIPAITCHIFGAILW